MYRGGTMSFLNNLFKKKERRNLGKRCDWDDIKVGEVFGKSGCFQVLYKKTKYPRDSILLSCDWGLNLSDSRIGEKGWIISTGRSYKLPKETQELWLP